MTKILIGSLFGWGVLILVGTQLLSRWPDNQVHVIFCDVGQGDSILIINQFTQVLIDSGRDTKVLDCLSRHFPPGDKNIEVVIATHADLDHIGGFSAVFRHFNVSHLFVSGFGKSTRDFFEFRTAVQELLSRGTKLYLGQNGQSVELKQKFQLKIISPRGERGTLSLFTGQKTEEQLSAIIHQQEAEYTSINDESIGAFLMIGRFKMLLMADIEKEGELALIKSRVLTRVNVLKAGHHGSKTSSTEPFLAKVKPEFVVMSVGKGNSYGHPHQEVLQRLAIYSPYIFRTDRDGDVVWIGNGLTFRWKTQHSR